MCVYTPTVCETGYLLPLGLLYVSLVSLAYCLHFRAPAEC